MNRMKFFRNKAGLSIGILARKIGLSNCSISHSESGYIKPWPKLRKAVSEALGVPEAEIFDEKGWVRQDD